MIKYIIGIFVSLLFFTSFPVGNVACAADVPLSESSVLSDLSSDETFNFSSYPKDSTETLSVLSLQEYGYSDIQGMDTEFALYLYLYNPSEKYYSFKNAKNKIQIKIGSEDNYYKYSLDFISVSDGNCPNRFIKYSVNLPVSKVRQSVVDGKRVYYVSGIELCDVGAFNATEYGISRRYSFSGYSKGFGIDKEKSTLVSEVNELETISLDVKHTSYKVWNSPSSADMISSAYFSVPGSFFKYGLLQKIHAEWNEYITKPMIVTTESDIYDGLSSWRHTDIGKYNKNVPYGFDDMDEDVKAANFTFNRNVSQAPSCYELDVLDFLLLATKIDDKFYVPSSDVEAEILSAYNYYKLKGKTDEEIISLIFEPEEKTSDKRTYGYNNVVIDAGEDMEIPSSSLGGAAFNWIYKILFPDINYSDIIYSPIFNVTADDLKGTDKEISLRLYIDENDVPAFKAYYNTEAQKGNFVYLFRFAQTDYTVYPLYTYETDKLIQIRQDGKTQYASETVFLDFDVIDLTFSRDNENTVIPVVANPINVIGSVDGVRDPEDIGDIVSDLIDKLKNEKNKVWDIIKKVLIALAVVLVAAFIIYIISSIVKKNKKSSGKNKTVKRKSRR